MKFLIVLAIAILGASAAPSVGDDSVVDHIKEVIAKILDEIPEPAIDIHDETASLDLGFEKLDFTFNDVVLSGIKSLETSTLEYDEDTGRLDYELTLPEVTADVEFDLVLSGLLDAVNHPIVDLVLSNLKLTGYAVIDTSDSPHKVTDFDLLVTLEGATVDLTGILNDDALTEKLETILNEQLPTMVNDIAVQLQPIANPLVKSILNLLISLTS